MSQEQINQTIVEHMVQQFLSSRPSGLGKGPSKRKSRDDDPLSPLKLPRVLLERIPTEMPKPMILKDPLDDAIKIEDDTETDVDYRVGNDNASPSTSRVAVRRIEELLDSPNTQRDDSPVKMPLPLQIKSSLAVQQNDVNNILKNAYVGKCLVMNGKEMVVIRIDKTDGKNKVIMKERKVKPVAKVPKVVNLDMGDEPHQKSESLAKTQIKSAEVQKPLSLLQALKETAPKANLAPNTTLPIPRVSKQVTLFDVLGKSALDGPSDNTKAIQTDEDEASNTELYLRTKMRTEIVRLRAHITELEQFIVKDLKKQQKNGVVASFKKFTKNMNIVQKVFAHMQMRNTKTVKGRRFTEEELKVAKFLYSRSKAGYNALKDVFILPDIKTIVRHLRPEKKEENPINIEIPFDEILKRRERILKTEYSEEIIKDTTQQRQGDFEIVEGDMRNIQLRDGKIEMCEQEEENTQSEIQLRGGKIEMYEQEEENTQSEIQLRGKKIEICEQEEENVQSEMVEFDMGNIQLRDGKIEVCGQEEDSVQSEIIVGDLRNIQLREGKIEVCEQVEESVQNEYELVEEMFIEKDDLVEEDEEYYIATNEKGEIIKQDRYGNMYMAVADEDVELSYDGSEMVFYQLEDGSIVSEMPENYQSID